MQGAMSFMSRNASKMDTGLGNLVRDARERAGLSQRALGDLIDVTGSTVQKYEDGSLKISIDTLSAIATATETDLQWFLETTGYLSSRIDIRTTPLEALDILRAAVTQSSAAEPNAELAASQLETLRSENAALKAELEKLRTSRGHGRTKVHVPPREAPPASDQRETGS